MLICICVGVLSHSVVSNSSVAPWSVACQAALSMEFSKQEYWSGLPFPSPGGLLHSGIKPVSLVSPTLAGGFFTMMPSEEPYLHLLVTNDAMNLLKNLRRPFEFIHFFQKYWLSACCILDISSQCMGWGGERICLQCRRPRFDSWVRKIPWRRTWQPTPVFLLGELHGQRSLVGCSP